MDFSGNAMMPNNQLQRWDLQTRRLRLISDLMEDYQENMRRAMRLIECEMGISSGMDVNMQNSARLRDVRNTSNVDEWLERVSQMTNNMYYPETAEERTDTQEVPFRVSASITTNPTNIRRGFIYTQLLDPQTDETNQGMSILQVLNATQLMCYDLSMNETRCPITWENFEQGQNILRINSCGHIFGHRALLQWFNNHTACPVCRTSLTENTTNSTNRTNATTATNRMRGLYDTNFLSNSFSSSSSSSNAINQLVSGIINNLVNSTMNTDSDSS